MGFKARLREILEKLTGRTIYKVLPLGINPLHDLVSSFPGYEFDTIFDVGAHLGESAKRFSLYFPKSRIYCFEPVSRTFDALVKNVQRYKNIACYHMALGSEKEEVTLVQQQRSDLNTLKKQVTDRVLPASPGGSERIAVNTLDDFCQTHHIRHISYLKIDTEGYDMKVLQGAHELLGREAIDFIELEAGMNPNNQLHVPFEEIKIYMEQKGYLLYGIYEQVQEWITQKPVLRRINPLFISGKMANSY